ncbi:MULTISPECIES: flavin reductase family protein [unclassified Saccharothrix]|uniref:flavin reductase family protein n=1 Tax=unclassified Saccharothrix TaxID=2593673 RepID=UPI00307ED4B5
MTAAPADRRYWDVVRRFPTGVSVVTTGSGIAAHGATVTSFTFVSREPPLVAVCLRRTSALLDLLGPRRVFAVNVLADDQAELARRFADPARGPGARQFDGVRWSPAVGAGGVPLLGDAVAWLTCRYVRRVPAGDHSVVLARVEDAVASERRPLVYFAGRLHPGVVEAEAGP